MVLFTSSVNFQDLLINMIYFNPQRWIQEFFPTSPPPLPPVIKKQIIQALAKAPFYPIY